MRHFADIPLRFSGLLVVIVVAWSISNSFAGTEVVVGKLKKVEDNKWFKMSVGQGEIIRFYYDNTRTKVLFDSKEILLRSLTIGSAIQVEYYGTRVDSALAVTWISNNGINRTDFQYGVTYANEDGELSSPQLTLKLLNDTLWWQSGHTFFNVGLSAVSKKDKDITREAGSDTLFLKSRKVLNLDMGGYYPLQEKSMGEKIGDFGLVAKGGVSSYNKPGTKNGDVDSYWAFGVRFTHHYLVPKDVNPSVISSVEFLNGRYENLSDRSWRWVVDAAIRIRSLNLNLIVNMGEGDDDVRFFVTQNKAISTLPWSSK